MATVRATPGLGLPAQGSALTPAGRALQEHWAAQVLVPYSVPQCPEQAGEV